MIDHILVHCSNARILRDLVLALVGVKCVFSLIIGVTLFSFYDFFCVKEEYKGLDDNPSVFIGEFGVKKIGFYLIMKKFQCIG